MRPHPFCLLLLGQLIVVPAHAQFPTDVPQRPALAGADSNDARAYYEQHGVSQLPQREMAGRPSCTTRGGRTVYGGGGIYPDVVLEGTAPVPLYLARLHEAQITAQWIGAYLSAYPGALESLDSLIRNPRLPEGAISNLRAFAARADYEIPTGEEVDQKLERALVPEIARAKWGAEAFFRISVPLDEQIAAARTALDQAERILGVCGAGSCSSPARP